MVEIPDEKIIFDIEHFQEMYFRLEMLQMYIDAEPNLNAKSLKKSVNELCRLADEHAIFLKNFRKNSPEITV